MTTPVRKLVAIVKVAFAIQFGFLVLSWFHLSPDIFFMDDDDSFSRTLSVNNNNESISSSSEFQEPKTRPVIYTFYYPIPMEVRHTEMSEEDDATLLKTWEITWHDAGWDPKVLTMADAKGHPNFDRLYHTILGKRFGISIQEELQYVKYLAMASTYKGGWYADYDVFPLYMDPTHTLPNDGNFTMYDGYMSSLMSGSASEWDRVGSGFIEFVGAKKEYVGNSIEAMQQYWPEISGVIQTNEVLRLAPMIKVEGCKQFKNRRAVHFAFWKIPNSRSREGYLLLQQWRQKCRPDDFAHVLNPPNKHHPSQQIKRYKNADEALMHDYYGDQPLNQ